MKFEFNSLYNALKNASQNNPHKIAIYSEKLKLSFNKLLEYSSNIAAYLQDIGVKPGDSVGIYMDNSWEYIVAIYAISRAGAVAVPINNTLKSKELSYILNDANIYYMFCNDKYKDIISKSIALHNCEKIIWVGNSKQPINFNNIIKMAKTPKVLNNKSSDIALILYTSGTQGVSKGAIITVDNIISNHKAIHNHVNFTTRDRGMAFLPMYHSFALLVATLFPINSGASIVIGNYKNPKELLNECALKRVTFFVGIPALYSSLVDIKQNWVFTTFNKLRFLICGGYPISKELILKVQNSFKRAQFIEGYGLTESTAVATANPLNKQKIGSVGVPLLDYKIKIFDSYDVETSENVIGEIVISGSNIMKTYLNSSIYSQCTIRNCWLHTGDLGYFDEEGYLYIVGRKKDLIIHKMNHIHPHEVEDIINNFDAVLESSVVAKKDDKYGEVPIAFIVAKKDKTVHIDNLKIYLKGFLAEYKIPKDFIILEQFPRNASGKVLKRKLREMV